ncbi:hypothetical protein SMQE21_19780 [Serratia marcescens]|nr:hypothetical protein SMQE21_19780 [Serratia marcescens]
MITQQTPIKSGFGPKTTAGEVLASQDLSGTLAIVTGGHSGLGLETTLALADAGARVIVACRAPAAAKAVLGLSAGVEIAELDLADLNSVRRFAADFTASSLRADIVINNAGVMACPEARVGNGWERQFATNHLGHYALTNLLWPTIADGGRVVTVSSAGHHHSAIRWEDVQFERGYDKWLAYGQSKTANALFAVWLDLLGRHLTAVAGIRGPLLRGWRYCRHRRPRQSGAGRREGIRDRPGTGAASVGAFGIADRH